MTSRAAAAPAAGQVDVQQHHVGPCRGDDRDGLLHGGRPRPTTSMPRVQVGLQPGPEDGVVVHDHDADRWAGLPVLLVPLFTVRPLPLPAAAGVRRWRGRQPEPHLGAVRAAGDGGCAAVAVHPSDDGFPDAQPVRRHVVQVEARAPVLDEDFGARRR